MRGESRYARWTTPDPLADKYLSTSPYAFCNNNPVNFVDPDGRVVWAIPAIVEAAGFVIAITATAYAAHKLYEQESSKYNPGWKHQERQDKKAKEELDKAQLNVQKSIKENYPDPDDYDPNNGPHFRSENKLITVPLLILTLIEDCSGDVSKYNSPQDKNNKDEVIIKPSDNPENREYEDKTHIEKLWEIIVNRWSY